MYLVPIIVLKSKIDGMGVFADSDIAKGTVVWKYANDHDVTMTLDEFDNLDSGKKKDLQRIAYLSPTTNRWVMPPEDDPACYTNHDPANYNTSIVVDMTISEEPIFVANKDIKKGEEITNNYLDFDKNSTIDKHSWLES